MNQWRTIFQKEVLEMWRSKKWIWVPIVFILIAVIDPITTYYMPQILDKAGNLPPGTVIKIPTPSAPEVLAKSLSQFNLLGVLVIVLITMGTVSGERKSGVAELILVKPVSYTSFISAKWASLLLLIWSSYFVSYLLSWYYVGQLFATVPFSDFIISFFIYGIWLTIVLTITLFFSSMLSSSGAAGALSLVVIIVLNSISGMLNQTLKWSPALLPSYTSEYIVSGGISNESLTATLMVTGIVIALLLVSSVLLFRKKEFAA